MINNNKNEQAGKVINITKTILEFDGDTDFNQRHGCEFVLHGDILVSNEKFIYEPHANGVRTVDEIKEELDGVTKRVNKLDCKCDMELILAIRLALKKEYIRLMENSINTLEFNIHAYDTTKLSASHDEQFENTKLAVLLTDCIHDSRLKAELESRAEYGTARDVYNNNYVDWDNEIEAISKHAPKPNRLLDELILSDPTLNKINNERVVQDIGKKVTSMCKSIDFGCNFPIDILGESEHPLPTLIEVIIADGRSRVQSSIVFSPGVNDSNRLEYFNAYNDGATAEQLTALANLGYDLDGDMYYNADNTKHVASKIVCSENNHNAIPSQLFQFSISNQDLVDKIFSNPNDDVDYKSEPIKKNHKKAFNKLGDSYYSYTEHRRLASAICNHKLERIMKLAFSEKTLVNPDYFVSIIRTHYTDELGRLIVESYFGGVKVRNAVNYILGKKDNAMSQPSVLQLLRSTKIGSKFNGLLHLVLSDRKYGYLIGAVNQLYITHNRLTHDNYWWAFGKLVNVDKLLFGDKVLGKCVRDNMLYDINPLFDISKYDIDLSIALEEMSYESDRSVVLDFISRYKLKGDIRVSNPIGSRISCTIYIKDIDLIICGCFKGNLNEFTERVNQVYTHLTHSTAYESSYAGRYHKFIYECKQ